MLHMCPESFVEDAMNSDTGKIIRSPSYPSISLKEAVAAIGKIEAQYRTAAVDRAVAAKLIGFSSLSGPANKALAALATYGLAQRAGKGEIRVTERARAILHAQSDNERARSLQEAAAAPKLFRDIRDRFAGIKSPPKDGVLVFLNRQGFNQSAVGRAAKAFLETMKYVEETAATESHGPTDDAAAESIVSDGDDAKVTYGGARVGDFVQWESEGALQFEEPRRVRVVTEDGKWVAVEGSETGIPMDQLIVEERASASETPAAAPRLPMSDQSAEEDVSNKGTDIRFKLGKGIVVQVRSREELGVSELEKLVRLIEAQRDALKD